MNKVILILFLIGISKVSLGVCGSTGLTLTEAFFKGGYRGIIFTCKIESVATTKSTSGNVSWNYKSTSIAKIITVYFGKVDTNFVTLNKGLQIGKIYLISTIGNGKVFSCFDECDSFSKQISDIPDSTYPVSLLKTFSEIFKHKKSGNYIFKNEKGIIIAEGKYKNGIPVGVWKHYNDKGNIKTIYDLKTNITTQFYSNGFIYYKTYSDNKSSYSEVYSSKIENQLVQKNINTKNDTGYVVQKSEYYEKGNLIKINCAHCDSESISKAEIYVEYYENGNLKLKGQKYLNRRIGLWQWYKENGEFNTEFDYRDGAGNQ